MQSLTLNLSLARAFNSSNLHVGLTSSNVYADVAVVGVVLVEG